MLFNNLYRKTGIVGIDATPFNDPREQYSGKSIMREIGKALAGFKGSDLMEGNTTHKIITGNWGCGMFGGDP